MKTFNEWFLMEQGKPYHGAWNFAEEAWNASAENSAERIAQLEQDKRILVKDANQFFDAMQGEQETIKKQAERIKELLLLLGEKQ